jgi:GTPase-activating protein BEM2
LFVNLLTNVAGILDLEQRLDNIRGVVHSLPRAHYYLLKRLVEHLDRVADFEDKNHMSVDNLATVMGPNLLRAPQDNFGVIMRNMGVTHMLLKALVMHVSCLDGIVNPS